MRISPVSHKRDYTIAYNSATLLSVLAGVVVLIMLIPDCCLGAARNLQDLVKNAQGSPKTILLSSGNWDVPADLEVPASIQLKIERGAKIKITSGKRLILHGMLEAAVEQIFNGDGIVTFDSNSHQRVYPQWWGAKGDGKTEDTVALQAAVNSFSDKGGEIFIPDGTYIIDSVGMKSNISLKGNSGNTILKQQKNARYCISTNPNNAKTNAPGNIRDNIKFSNITFMGSVDTYGFSEFMPLLDIRGANNVNISKCHFIGFRGDGIYIGQTGTQDTIYHNSKIFISECVFDGINKNNRNGVSVIDGDDIVIEKCMFKNIARPDMPGAIDFEPNEKSNIIRNIKISGNRFETIGGNNIIQISITFKLGRLDKPIQNIEIINNVIEGDGKANGIYIGQPQFADSMTPANNILVSKNIVRNTKRSFMIFGLKDVRMINNIFDGCKYAPYIAYSEININVRDMKVIGNTFKNLSTEDGGGISIFGAYNLEFRNNTFDNIGKTNGSSGNALFFRKHGGPADYVTINNNTFKGSKTKVAIQREKGNITYTEHNRISGNTFWGNNSVFLPAPQSD
jgi:hypothetical protein